MARKLAKSCCEPRLGYPPFQTFYSSVSPPPSPVLSLILAAASLIPVTSCFTHTNSNVTTVPPMYQPHPASHRTARHLTAPRHATPRRATHATLGATKVAGGKAGADGSVDVELHGHVRWEQRTDRRRGDSVNASITGGGGGGGRGETNERRRDRMTSKRLQYRRVDPFCLAERRCNRVVSRSA